MAQSKLKCATFLKKHFSNTIGTSYAAGTQTYTEFTLDSISGYTPIAIIGISGSGSAPFSYSDWYFSADNKIRVYFRNNASGAKTLNALGVDVLYVKSDSWRTA